MPAFPFRAPGFDLTDDLVSQLHEECPELLHAIRREWLVKELDIYRTYPDGRAAEKKCTHVPRTLTEYIHHVVEMQAAIETAIKRVRLLKAAYKRSQWPPHLLGGAFRGKVYGLHPDFLCPIDYDNPENNDGHFDHPLRGAVLAQPTIWARHAPLFGCPFRHFINWPCPHEMAWEGDQRVASENGRYGRFPPLPRRAQYDSDLPWNQRAYIPFLDFDNCWAVPEMDEVYCPVDQIEDHAVPVLLNQDLRDAIDDDAVPFPKSTLRAYLGDAADF